MRAEYIPKVPALAGLSARVANGLEGCGLCRAVPGAPRDVDVVLHIWRYWYQGNKEWVAHYTCTKYSLVSC